MTTRTFRLRAFEISPAARTSGQAGAAADELAHPEFEAVCVSGDEEDCGEKSGPLPDADHLDTWMAEHTRDTGHRRYRRAYCEYATVEPGAWL
ncbi:hypothetical protein RI578_40500 (plasmid) [Streptomyces sp. BB1-1-1]|uniref:DUF7848 domain-containing protein n=1 Tax=Streptomyces sp. BB1-1-1 TaxID=3074430 RepID=UPI002877E0B9|nr:hypothetical protein [Streptomyces sp. BB1-1-1]WND40574.1 hypothetical protein RI578_40500 [Streptomyces sp. BB1-1-1]